jgi:GT2 family glycosyltransferase
VDSLNFNNNTRAVSIIKGAAMVVRRAAFEQVGGMDETTRAYGEEADWHLRLRQAGWQVVYLDDALITHFGAGQANLRLHGWVLAEDRKAILAYYLKHRPRWQALCVRWMILVMHSLWALLWLPFNRSNSRDHWQTVKMAATFTRTS